MPEPRPGCRPGRPVPCSSGRPCRRIWLTPADPAVPPAPQRRPGCPSGPLRQRRIGNAPIRRLLARGHTALSTTLDHLFPWRPVLHTPPTCGRRRIPVCFPGVSAVGAPHPPPIRSNVDARASGPAHGVRRPPGWLYAEQSRRRVTSLAPQAGYALGCSLPLQPDCRVRLRSLLDDYQTTFWHRPCGSTPSGP
jgi:hypothetical protein